MEQPDAQLATNGTGILYSLSIPYPDRMSAIARALAVVLNSTREVDDRLSSNVFLPTPSQIGEQLYSEMLYVNNSDRAKRLIELNMDCTLCEQVFLMCEKIIVECRQFSNLSSHVAYNLLEYHGNVHFVNRKIFTVDTTARRLYAGGLVLDIITSVRSKIETWLRMLRDRIIRTYTEEADLHHYKGSLTESTIEKLSNALTVHTTDKHYTPLNVESLILSYYDHPEDIKTRLETERASLIIIVDMMKAASISPAELKQLLDQRVDLIRTILNKPPISLRCSEIMDLNTMIGVGDRLDLHSLSIAIYSWANEHGRCSMLFHRCISGLEELQHWKLPVDPFLKSIKHIDPLMRPRPKSIPQPTHVPFKGEYTFDTRVVRSGLEFADECDMRLISTVRELHAMGEFTAGHVDAALVSNAAVICQSEAIAAFQALVHEQKFQGLQVGPMLEATKMELTDVTDGQFGHVVAAAAHEMRNLSMCDLFETMRISGGRYEDDQLAQLVTLLQPLLYCPLQQYRTEDEPRIYTRPALRPNYIGCALGMVLPAIAKLRTTVRIEPTQKGGALLSGLAAAVGPRAIKQALDERTPLRFEKSAMQKMPPETVRWIQSFMHPASHAPSVKWDKTLRLVRQCRRAHRIGAVQEIEILDISIFTSLVSQIEQSV